MKVPPPMREDHSNAIYLMGGSGESCSVAAKIPRTSPQTINNDCYNNSYVSQSVHIYYT